MPYKCNCGEMFPEATLRFIHATSCPEMKRHFENAELKEKVTALSLRVGQYRKALEFIVGFAPRIDLRTGCEAEMHKAAWDAIHGEKPKSDGWHCPMCNLITDRAGLACPDCAVNIKEMREWWECGCLSTSKCVTHDHGAFVYAVATEKPKAQCCPAGPLGGCEGIACSCGCHSERSGGSAG